MKSAAKFDHIAVIYNPISTGNAPRMAENLVDKINHDAHISTQATLTPTKYARHAEELARKISLKYKHPLIISVSGDGGYNEVINGVMDAKERADRIGAVVAVVGAGNANDHRRVIRDQPIIELIRSNHPKPMDLLQINTTIDSKPFARYAHSYIGFGVSPQVALRLNRHKLNRVREVQILVKTLFTFRPVKITHSNTSRLVDSLIFANINEMAKILKFRRTPQIRDGKFEVIEFPHRSKLHLVKLFLVTAFFGYRSAESFSAYRCTFDDESAMQLDGEVDSIPAHTEVTIVSKKQAIDALY